MNGLTGRKKEGMDCVVCGKVAKPAKLSFQGEKVAGFKCACGEEYFNPEEAQRILTMNKLRGETVEAKLGRIKSNLILRIPKAFEEVLGLKNGEKMRLKLKDKELVMSPA